MDALRRLDARAARAEAALATAVLVAMVLIASLQALSFNLAERDVSFARAALDRLDWVDAFLQKGTLWLAFLGASLATHHDKHIGVDLLPRLVSRENKARLTSFAALGSGVIALILSGVYLSACIVADAAVPFDYEVLGANGPVHVCDARPDELTGSGLESVARPTLLCALRAALASAGVPVSSGAGVAQLIAPLMFAVIGLRLLARGAGLALGVTRDGAEGRDQGIQPRGGAE